jgi:hypothetical protein
MGKTIQELIDNGILRVGSHEGYVGESYAGPMTPEQVVQANREQYVGAVALAPSDEFPADIDPAGAHVWAERYYHKYDRWGLQRVENDGTPYGKRIYNTPDLWILTWSSDEVEAAWQASRQAASVIDLEEFHIRRSGTIDQA